MKRHTARYSIEYRMQRVENVAEWVGGAKVVVPQYHLWLFREESVAAEIDELYAESGRRKAARALARVAGVADVGGDRNDGGRLKRMDTTKLVKELQSMREGGYLPTRSCGRRCGAARAGRQSTTGWGST